MNYTHLPPFGHAMCPHCRTQFDLAGALPTFIEKCPHNDHALYAMCPQCAGQYQNASSQTRKAMSNLCFVNYKIKARSPDGKFFPWAVTTTLTLALNNYDIVAAIENGHSLSRGKYFEMCASENTILHLPGGMCLVTSTTPGGHDENL